MTPIIKQLNSISVENTYKTHDLLDKVLGSIYEIYQEDEIRFNQQNITFEYKINDKHTFVIVRDLNTFSVVSRVVTGNDIVGECVIDIAGSYSRKFGDIDPETKVLVSRVFALIANIDTSNLMSMDTAEEAAEPDGESPAEPENVEAEIVSEG